MKNIPDPTRGRQPGLFRLENPLVQRFGTRYFASLPKEPGVYRFFDDTGRLLYIGQSASLRTRIGSYRHVTPDRHPRRTLRLGARIRRIEWEICGTAHHPMVGSSCIRFEIMLLTSGIRDPERARVA